MNQVHLGPAWVLKILAWPGPVFTQVQPNLAPLDIDLFEPQPPPAFLTDVMSLSSF